MNTERYVMRQMAVLALALISLVSLSSCRKKNESNIIIAKKAVVIKAHKPQKMGDGTNVCKVNWMGDSFTIEVSLRADTSLPLATDGVTEFYDNRVSLRIIRSDGSEFFSRTFTKTDFKPYVDSAYYKNGALLGIVFDKVAGSQLQFAASVGSPDKTSDEYVPLVLTVNKAGSVSIAKDTETDDNAPEE